ncbi:MULTISPECIES: precorrin-4 C(11)-methyltransferase [Luteococcus]|uniref:Cobalt-precorrin-4 C11-methyltransferase n=1 Tax=Luteococcus japonicus LSP_Lj1 TaxID=1255658 RepID=A0A1R4K8X7_9ACTN|nr:MULTISPECIES: precorrin-4 C(11)-methyltransferase [Luteococcus]MDN5563586.1 precorrin-4 C(11)-methyltransferase [Luteococcus sp.]SJN40770.1 Cobalt-precorrin-4 C11-methyltransferase [Luteococcus japonicus LSP_Lj1]
MTANAPSTSSGNVQEAPGRVVFVGAGPGAADLITVRGARIIAQADVIIWASSLVHPGIVADHKPGAEVIDSASIPLEDLEPHYRRALDGQLIARVHTGDPSIYGATAEQRQLCDRLGVAYETVPGVSAFSAAAARMDVEITMPEVSQSLILTRLEGGRTPMPPKETVRGFAQHGATMALYLSAARNKVLQEELLAGGYPPETPCIVGHQVSWPDEMMLRCTLGELHATMKEHHLWKHTVVLVGPALAEGPMVKRSHLYHPGFRHEYRPADPQAQDELRRRGALADPSTCSTHEETR